MNTRSTASRLGLALAMVLAVYAGLVVADRRPLRAAEGAYLNGREVTACATRELRPFAEEARDLAELPTALEQLIGEARDDARAVNERSRSLPSGLLPGTRDAVRGVREALDAQVALYDAMADDPQDSEDELVALGRANGAAERRMRSARRWLVAEEADDWGGRFTCRSAGRTGQADSGSSSSK